MEFFSHLVTCFHEFYKLARRMSDREDKQNFCICFLETFCCSLPLSSVSSVVTWWSKAKQTLRNMWNSNLETSAPYMWGLFVTDLKISYTTKACKSWRHRITVWTNLFLTGSVSSIYLKDIIKKSSYWVDETPLKLSAQKLYWQENNTFKSFFSFKPRASKYSSSVD